MVYAAPIGIAGILWYDAVDRVIIDGLLALNDGPAVWKTLKRIKFDYKIYDILRYTTAKLDK